MKPADLVMQSYGRCCASEGFFDSFYRYFLASSPQIRDRFTNTDMPAQKQLLRHGILNLVMYARGMPDTKLRALGVTHARDGFNIRPELYDLWLVSLQQAIGDHDKACNADILQAWREVLSKGINVIKYEY